MAKLMTRGLFILAMERARAEGLDERIDDELINLLNPAYHYPVFAVREHFERHGRSRIPHVCVEVEVRTRMGGIAAVSLVLSQGMYDGLPEDIRPEAVRQEEAKRRRKFWGQLSNGESPDGS
jgi:hypothetical protein